MFKKILIGIIAVIVILYLVSLVLPSEVQLERNTTINAKPNIIFEQVNNLKNWENWSPWGKRDTAAEYTYSENHVGEGASFSWSGDKVGKGSLRILESTPYQSIKTEVDFGEQGIAYGNWDFKQVSDKKVKVTWGFVSDLNGPVDKYFGLFMDYLLGPDYEEGLSRLKEYSENVE